MLGFNTLDEEYGKHMGLSRERRAVNKRALRNFFFGLTHDFACCILLG